MAIPSWIVAIVPGTLIVRKSDMQVRLVVQCSINVFPQNWIQLRILSVGNNVVEFATESHTFERTWKVLTT